MGTELSIYYCKKVYATVVTWCRFFLHSININISKYIDLCLRIHITLVWPCCRQGTNIETLVMLTLHMIVSVVLSVMVVYIPQPGRELAVAVIALKVFQKVIDLREPADQPSCSAIICKEIEVHSNCGKWQIANGHYFLQAFSEVFISLVMSRQSQVLNFSPNNHSFHSHALLINIIINKYHFSVSHLALHEE